MDTNRYARSRTNSTGSLPATPAHTPNTSTLSRSSHGVFQSFQQFQTFSVSPDLLAANLSRVRAEQGSRGSSIPPTPAPTPNLLSHNHMIPEQLVAGIKNLRADEGYIESSSFPATPAPSPFSPSPAQFSAFSPDQVAESIRRLRDEDSVSGQSGENSGQPPTPSSTPGPVNAHQLIIPERLAESIQHLRCDEGLESTSNPATPVPTPISPIFAQQGGQRAHQVLPEQLAAGIHRLKVEEGMSSGGSSGFPSTPAPTPFTYHPGGVRPEDLAAGISRLSVIEEGDGHTNSQHKQKVSIRVVMEESGGSQPNLSQYFGDANDGASVSSFTGSASFFDQLSPSNVSDERGEDVVESLESRETAVLHSCRESRVDLPNLAALQIDDKQTSATSGAKIDVAEQVYDDARSLARRHSHDGESRRHHHSSVSENTDHLTTSPSNATESTTQNVMFNVFAASNIDDPFDTILSEQQRSDDQAEAGESRPEPPSTLPTIAEPVLVNSTPTSHAGSTYATPCGATPSGEQSFIYTVQTSTPIHQGLDGPPSNSTPTQIIAPPPAMTPIQPCGPPPSNLTPYHSGVPITSPLPNAGMSPAAIAMPPAIFDSHESVGMDDDAFTPEFVRRRDAWIPSPATLRLIDVARSGASSTPSFPDRSMLTSPGIHFRDVLQDPVRNLILHYRGDSEAAKRQVLTADSVSQDERGLRQLIDAGCYRAAINLTTRLLLQLQQGQQGNLTKHSPYSIRLWWSRLSLLVKLKQFSNAEVEAEPFADLDKPDLYFDFYPETYPDRRGSMVPFQLRILLAEMPHHLGKHHEALDRLHALLATVDQMLSNLGNGKSEDGRKMNLGVEDQTDSIELWGQRRRRIIYSMANCAISQKLKQYNDIIQNRRDEEIQNETKFTLDFDLAFTALEMLLVSEKEENKPKIKSSIGRVFLQLGDLLSASEVFEEAKKMRDILKLESRNELECENLLDASFLSIASNNYVDALSYLENANLICPGNPVIITNTSVCLLYLGRLKDAIANLESNLTSNPALFLQETPVLNLATLYELESSFAGQKKLALLDLMGQFSGDGVNTSCLKF